MNGRVLGALVAAIGILMSLNAIISGPQAFGAGKFAVFVLTLIGFATTVAGLWVLRTSSK